MSPGHSLTPFGDSLSKAVQKRDKLFETSVEKCGESYSQNLSLIHLLKSKFAVKKSALIFGAGSLDTSLNVNQLSEKFIFSGVQWTDFHDGINMDILLSTHVSPLQASFNRNLTKKPPIIIHGIYSKSPPVLNNSITFRWSDPLLDPNWIKNPTISALEKIIQKKAFGPAPYMPAVRNVIFLNAMIMIWLGAKQIVFAGIDPCNPIYYFHGNKEKSLEIIKAVSLIDPYISIWDGRNERIAMMNRDTDHRIQEIISDLSQQKSAVGDKKRLDVMIRGLTILKKYSEFKGVKIGYIGESKFLKDSGIARLD